MVRRLLSIMRPDQWTKNLVLFAGLIFAGDLGDADLAMLAVKGFLVFCLLSGASYILNDLLDIQSDRMHPEKSARPLASGELSVTLAVGAGIVAAVGALVWAYTIHPEFGHTAAAYLLLNVVYTLVLKRMVILDVMSIAVGFVLRAVASVEVLTGASPGIELSPWLLVCTFFLALFLGLGAAAADHRATLAHYTPPLMDALIGVVTAATVVSYAIYTIWPGTVEKVGSSQLVYTVPFVVYGVFRYLYLMVAKGSGGRPSRVLVTDVPLGVNILLWVGIVIVVIYGS